MTPKQEGILLLSAFDHGIELEHWANATLLISDILRIELEGGGLIEEGGSLNVTFKVYDSQNLLFEKSSYKHMNIEPKYEGIGTDKGK